MKLHFFRSIRSHKKATALSLTVLMTSVILGGCYANTVEGQSVIEGIIQQIPQAAASAPSSETQITVVTSSSEDVKVTIPETAAPVKAMVTALVTAEDKAQATEAVTQAAQEAMTQATAVATVQAATAATQAATEATTQETVKPTAAAPVKAAPAATTAAPAAATAAPATTEAAPAATEAAPAVVEVAKTADTSGSYNSDMAYAVLDLVNQQRAAAGLAGLTWNGTLAESANIRASEIVIKWAHTRPDGSEWWTAGAQMQMGENLAYGQSSASQVVTEWMASPGHAANILGAYTVMGVSCYYTNGTYYWAQHFA